jgi:hypothetical protein
VAYAYPGIGAENINLSELLVGRFDQPHYIRFFAHIGNNGDALHLFRYAPRARFVNIGNYNGPRSPGGKGMAQCPPDSITSSGHNNHSVFYLHAETI